MIDIHPAPEQLAAFRLGKLGDGDLAEIEAHVAQCDSCCQNLKSLPDDSFVSLVRQTTDSTFAPEAVAVDKGQQTWDQGDTLATGPEAEVPLGLRNHPRYEIMEKLGQGGMGVVFKARHRLMERVVALKVLHPNLVGKSASVERFLRELKGAARLTHPNIVAAFDSEEAGNRHFLVMEYVPGISLARLVEEQGPLPVPVACGYIRQTALGLQHAFECGMVHRDIKPQNLMVVNESAARSASKENVPPLLARRAAGIVKILDFGLARFVSETVGELPPGGENSDSDSRLTQASTVMGTPEYIAPEQAQSAAAADIRADIYSLGCTLYFLLAGHAPFPHGSALEKIKAHHKEKPKSLSEIRSEVPAELVQVVDRMLAKDPAQRLQTPAEVATALAPFAMPQAVPETKKPSRKWTRARRFAVAASILVLFGCLAYLFIPPVRDFAQFVIRYANNKGVLIIQANDQELEITIKQNGKEVAKGVVIDRASQRAFELTAGNGEILVRGTDANQARKFELRRGERIIFSAPTLLDPQLAKQFFPFIADDGSMYLTPREADSALIASFAPPQQPISKLGIVPDQGGWRIEVNQPDKVIAQPALESRNVQLFEVDNPPVEDCLLVFRAKMKSNFPAKGSAYPILGCNLPQNEVTFSNTPNNWASGNTDWAIYETSMRLEKGKRPSQLRLYVWVSGQGTVWIKDLAVFKAPLPPEEKKKELRWDPTDLHFSRLKHARVRDVADAVNRWLKDNGWNRPDVSVGMSSDYLTNSLSVQIFCRDKSLSEEISKLVKRLDNPAADREFFQGHWMLIKGEENGVRIPQEMAHKAKPFKFSGDRVRFSQNGNEYEGIFKLNPSKGPKWIDVKCVQGNGTVVFRGIYQFDFNLRHLKLCLGGPGENRPKEFSAPKGTNIQSLTLAWISLPHPIQKTTKLDFGILKYARADEVADAINKWQKDNGWSRPDVTVAIVADKLKNSLQVEVTCPDQALADGISQLVNRLDNVLTVEARELVERLDKGPQVALQQLFNGKNLDGWEGDLKSWKVGKDELDAAKDELVGDYGFLHTKQAYENFELRLQFRVSPAQSLKPPPTSPTVWIQLDDRGKDKPVSGLGIVLLAEGGLGLAPTGGAKLKEYKDIPLSKPLNRTRWNELKVLCKNGEVFLFVNGEIRARGFQVEPRRGFIGLQTGIDRLHIRNVEIREWPPAKGDAQTLRSGPQPGEQVKSFQPFHGNGPWEGKKHSFVDEFGADPVALIFVRNFSPPLFRLLSKVNEAAGKHKNAKLHSVVVILDDKDSLLTDKRFLALIGDAKFKDTIVGIDNPAGPLGYKILKDADVTVILYVNKKVRANFAYGKDGLTEKEKTKILTALPRILLAKQEPAFQPLFNGKDLSGWKGDAKDWKVQDKTLNFHGKQSSLLQTEKVFQNYVLRFEHWVEPRVGGEPPYLNLHLHYPVGNEIRDKDRDRPLVHFLMDGAVHYGPRDYKLRPLTPTVKTKAKKSKKFGWNKVEVHSRGGELETFVNGESVALMHPGKARSGFIALEPHWGEYSFRNVEIQPLPDDAKPTFQPLFNGKDLTGWEGDKELCTWKDDRLVMKAGNKVKTHNVDLWTKRSFKDFELRFEYYHATINGIVRVIPHGKVAPKDAVRVHGTEALKIHWVGTVSGSSPNNRATQKSNQFAFNEVIIKCVGKLATTEVNGEVVAEEKLEEKEGVLVLNLQGVEEQEAMLRNVWIRELPESELKK